MNLLKNPSQPEPQRANEIVRSWMPAGKRGGAQMDIVRSGYMRFNTRRRSNNNNNKKLELGTKELHIWNSQQITPIF